MKKTKLMLGDNIESLKKLPDNSIDSIVTDPPYGLSFMNKKWDYDVPSIDFWKEVYRVLKPGGHVLSFGGTRTYHRMVVNIEDAGFEIRDQIQWLYGSGFPKSHNIGKAVDKFGGNNLLSTEIGSKLKEARLSRGLTLKQADELFCGGTSNYNWLEGRSDGQRIPNQELFDKIVSEWSELKDLRDKVIASERELLGVEITNKTIMKNIGETNVSGEYERTKGTSPYEGWGTALKPANEPICVARKPLSEKSVAENVLKWGTGGINIDGCRIGTDDKLSIHKGNLFNGNSGIDNGDSFVSKGQEEGRFPANIILDETAAELLDEQSGVTKSSKIRQPLLDITGGSYNKAKGNTDIITERGHNDSGGASRFFYVAKVSKKERNLGLDGFDDKKPDYIPRYSKDSDGNMLRADGSIVKEVINKNTHPTLKPINLMTYLCRLVTPEGGIVLDPFMGSGSTGIAALLEGFRFVGMEMDKDYFKIAEARIEAYGEYRPILKK